MLLTRSSKAKSTGRRETGTQPRAPPAPGSPRAHHRLGKAGAAAPGRPGDGAAPTPGCKVPHQQHWSERGDGLVLRAEGGDPVGRGGVLSRDPVMHGVSKKRGEASLASHTSPGPHSGHGSGYGGHRHRLEEHCTPKGSPYGIQQPREEATARTGQPASCASLKVSPRE